MSPLTAPAPTWATSAGLLLVRVTVGAAFVMHGLAKVHNPFGWMNGTDTAPPGAVQALAVYVELGGGGLLIAGLFTRVAALLLAAQMVAALALVHIPHGDPFVAQGRPSAELACAYLAVALAVAALGAGAYSLDAPFFGRRRAAATALAPAH
ncbi:MAG: DoxX family protein [Planctomycetes bacterium]|nr:DoxX family protein [Planctomycetota bacterium]